MEKDYLLSFFAKLTSLSWWSRLFHWQWISGQIQGQLKEIQDTWNREQREWENREKEGTQKISQLSQESTQLLSDRAELKALLGASRERIGDLEKSNQVLAERKDDIERQLNEEKRTIASFIKEKELMTKEYEKRVDSLNRAHEQMCSREEAIEKAKEEERREKLERLKKTWIDHELQVEEKIRNLCQKHQIEYIEREQVPFTGKPDNAVKICDEIIIFDAKSPQTDDLGNFEKYIKTQTEAVKKYAKKDDVKNEIFLVVPNNAIETLRQHSFDLADYQVFVITTDSLEPILLCLKRIETYEFAETLNPEDRQAICTILGKMAHGIKRRIQVDQYFTKEFLALLSHADNMPKDILQESLKVERASKLNPPQEKRAKTLPLEEIIKDHQKITAETQAKGINVSQKLHQIEDIPLYKK